MRRLSIIALMAAAALMTACGGGSQTISGTGTGSGTGGTGGTTKTTLSMGSGTGAFLYQGIRRFLDAIMQEPVGALYTEDKARFDRFPNIAMHILH